MDWIAMKKIIILAIFILGLSGHAQAAQISLEVSNTKISVGDEFLIKIFLDTENEEINAIDLGILYPALLNLQKISRSESGIKLWVNEPNFTKEAIFLGGGVPGGIKGQHILIATIQAQANAVGDGALGLSPASRVLLNDGQGTEAQLTFNNIVFTVLPQKKNQKPEIFETPSRILTKDYSKPRSFEITISNDADIFGGKSFVSFFTNDLGSGIDHYEIKEGDGDYKIARSPYLLSDQELHSVIKIKAVDGSGNHRVVTYPGVFKRLMWWISSIFK